MEALNLFLVLIGNSLQRNAAGASGVLVGLYLAQLANRGSAVGAGLVGVLGAVSFGAELIAATPMGIASDVIATRRLMTGGSLLGAGATQLFGMTGLVSIFFLSRGLEGIGAAAVAPPLLAHLTDVTDHKPVLRAKAVSYFELSLLVGLALGGLLAGQLWRKLGTQAFGAVAFVYLFSAVLLHAGAVGSRWTTLQFFSPLWGTARPPGLNCQLVKLICDRLSWLPGNRRGILRNLLQYIYLWDQKHKILAFMRHD